MNRLYVPLRDTVKGYEVGGEEGDEKRRGGGDRRRGARSHVDGARVELLHRSVVVDHGTRFRLQNAQLLHLKTSFHRLEVPDLT